ncbi:MAG: GNAT family N-acetyltransferase [Hyphomicrobiales bacterium]|nr:GNAT family N-acetyltransferase [Hyphomicrobiales bacterium]MCP5371053.1 GNAT family N-acetyltransferase [Hyphomicrobiales bacterium]
MGEHLLDRPVWSALATVHAGFSLGTARARRFRADISPFGAVPDEDDASLDELGKLVAATGGMVLAQVPPVVCPPGARQAMAAPALQMVYDGTAQAPRPDQGIRRLGEADAPAMEALAALTRPGPFAARTVLLGEYWGIKEEGRLVAMAGERLKQPGLTEVSGVCTHPDHRGRGWARDLCLLVTGRILARGEGAYLHVFADNTPAIALYHALGFRQRRPIHVAVLEPA